MSDDSDTLPGWTASGDRFKHPSGAVVGYSVGDKRWWWLGMDRGAYESAVAKTAADAAARALGYEIERVDRRWGWRLANAVSPRTFATAALASLAALRHDHESRATAQRVCAKCDGAGWVWRHQLGDSTWHGEADDTRYTCPDCVARCEVTGNECGSDTWMVGRPCQCEPCRKYVASAEAAAPSRPESAALRPGFRVLEHYKGSPLYTCRRDAQSAEAGIVIRGDGGWLPFMWRGREAYGDNLDAALARAWELCPPDERVEVDVCEGCPNEPRCPHYGRGCRPPTDRAPVAEPPETCAGCAKVARHPAEGYECMRHPAVAEPPVCTCVKCGATEAETGEQPVNLLGGGVACLDTSACKRRAGWKGMPRAACSHGYLRGCAYGCAPVAEPPVPSERGRRLLEGATQAATAAVAEHLAAGRAVHGRRDGEPVTVEPPAAEPVPATRPGLCTRCECGEPERCEEPGTCLYTQQAWDAGAAELAAARQERDEATRVMAEHFAPYREELEQCEGQLQHATAQLAAARQECADLRSRLEWVRGCHATAEAARLAHRKECERLRAAVEMGDRIIANHEKRVGQYATASLEADRVLLAERAARDSDRRAHAAREAAIVDSGCPAGWKPSHTRTYERYEHESGARAWRSWPDGEWLASGEPFPGKAMDAHYATKAEAMSAALRTAEQTEEPKP